MEEESNLNTTLNYTKNIIHKTEKEVQNFRLLKKVANKGNSAINLTENDLIRDILYVFQGIEGHNIIFMKNEDTFTVKTTIPLSNPVRKMVNYLCEMGWLFRKISVFAQDSSETVNGLIN